MVLNTQAGNQHGFDTLLPLQALSVHVSWVNCLSSHRRNPGFWCSSLSQDVVRNHTGFWAWSLWMCHPGNRLHLQEWLTGAEKLEGDFFFFLSSEHQKFLIHKATEHRGELCFVISAAVVCVPLQGPGVHLLLWTVLGDHHYVYTWYIGKQDKTCQ